MKNLKGYWTCLTRFPVLLTKIVIIVLLFSQNNFAQFKPDTLKETDVINEEFVMQKSPAGAVLRSAVLPGWGQFYNESYWKIPVVWGFLGYYTYEWIRADDNYKKYRDLYIESNRENSIYRNLRDDYLDFRDSFTIYFIAAYLLNMIDAYVDAHMFDFNVTPDTKSNGYNFNLQLKL